MHSPSRGRIRKSRKITIAAEGIGIPRLRLGLRKVVTVTAIGHSSIHSIKSICIISQVLLVKVVAIVCHGAIRVEMARLLPMDHWWYLLTLRARRSIGRVIVEYVVLVTLTVHVRRRVVRVCVLMVHVRVGIVHIVMHNQLIASSMSA